MFIKMLARCSDICPRQVAQFGERVESFDMGDIVEGGESLVGQLFEDPEPQAEAPCYPNTCSPELQTRAMPLQLRPHKMGIHLDFPP